jgi:hypothetical protein
MSSPVQGRLPQETMSEGAREKEYLTNPSRRLSDRRGPGSGSSQLGPSVSPRERPGAERLVLPVMVFFISSLDLA